MMVVEKLSKLAQFIPLQSSYSAMQIGHNFMQNIFRLHRLPKTIISDHDVKFTSSFSKNIFEGLGTQLNISIAYHPQMDRQIEPVNHVVEDMPRSYVMQQPSKWEDHLHLVEYAYNNDYHTSL